MNDLRIEYVAKLSNGAYWQIIRVLAYGRGHARALAELEAARALPAERKAAILDGKSARSVRAYKLFSLESVERSSQVSSVRFIDSGAEG